MWRFNGEERVWRNEERVVMSAFTRFSLLITRFSHWLCRTARLAIGIPDYETYLAHLRQHHPERVPMSREDFFIERMNARYGKGRSRCC